MSSSHLSCSVCKARVPSDGSNGPKPTKCPSCGGLLVAGQDGASVPAWYYAKGKEKIGPLSLDKLRQLAAAGQLQTADMVLQEGSQKWLTAGSVSGLFTPAPDVSKVAGPPLRAVRENTSPAESPQKGDSSGRPRPAGGQTPPDAKVGPHTAPPQKNTARPGPGGTGRLRLKPGFRPVPDYELIELLGQGGYGEVWKARGPGGSLLAIKFIPLGDDAGKVELRSLELMKGVKHSNLLRLFGLWKRDGLLIVAMELADRTLQDRLDEAIRQGLPGLPKAEALQYIREAAQGLDHLNSLGVQHRDMKPQNLLLAGGVVKVADFGLAKSLEKTRATHSGAMTVAYAAPEFFKNEFSAYSDQYSLAVTYCRLRGGRLPFGENAAQAMAGHLFQPPDLTMLSEPERAATARALAKKPEDRWPSCTAFAKALIAGRSAKPSTAIKTANKPPHKAEKPPRRSWLGAMLVAAALLLVCGLAAGVFFWSRGFHNPPAQPDPRLAANPVPPPEIPKGKEAEPSADKTPDPAPSPTKPPDKQPDKSPDKQPDKPPPTKPDDPPPKDPPDSPKPKPTDPPTPLGDDVASLTKQLTDKDGIIRLKAAKALGKLGADAKDAVPALTNALTDSDEDVRDMAKKALAKINDALAGADKDAALALLNNLVKDLKNPDKDAQAKAAAGLTKLLKNDAAPIRAKAAHALGDAGVAAKSFQKELDEAAKDADDSVRREARDALASIDAALAAEKKTQARQKLAPLLKDLNDKSPVVRQKALEGIADLGPDGIEASEQVLALLNDKVPALQQSALDTLEKVNPTLHNPILTLLVDREDSHKTEAIRQLGKLGVEAKPAIPTLVRFYQIQATLPQPPFDRVHWYSTTILTSLNEIDAENKDFQILLVNGITDPVQGDLRRPRSTAIKLALDLIKSKKLDPTRVVKPLVSALSGNPDMQAIKALGEIGVDAKDALPALKLLKTNPDQTIRDAVSDAIKKIE